MDDNVIHTPNMVQAEGHLVRVEQIKKRFDGAIRRRLIGGVIMMIGLLALIGFLVYGNQFIAVVATASLCVGILVSSRGAHFSMYTFTENITDACTRLELLEEQPDNCNSELRIAPH